MPRARPHMHHGIKPCTMAHWGGIDGGIIGADLIHIALITQRHGDHHTMGDHHPFGLSGGPRGVKEPCQIIALARGHAVTRPPIGPDIRKTRGIHHDQFGHLRHLVQRFSQGGLGENHSTVGIVQDKGRFPAMQLGIDWHRHGPRDPDAVEHDKVIGHILAIDRHTVAGCDSLVL